MSHAPSFFTSAAAFQIGCLLAFPGVEVSLRQLATRGGLGIRSVQLATQKLEKQKLIVRRKRGHRVYFSLGSGPAIEELMAVTTLRQKRKLYDRAAYHSKRSTTVLQKTAELVQFARLIRRRNNKVLAK